MKIPNNRVFSAVNFFKQELSKYYGSSELESILSITFNHYFGLNRMDLILEKEKLLSESELLKVMAVVKSLKQRKPLAQILGQWEFYGITFKVNEHTLIPRPETEELVQLIIDDNIKSNKLSILDLGTGSGCIPISLKANIQSAKIDAIDISEEALKMARENARMNNVNVSFSKFDILNWKNLKLNSTYDVIVSNPPYIGLQEKELMDDNVLNYEPHVALFIADEEPLLFYEAIADLARVYLNENGRLYFEINEKYGSEMESLLFSKKFKNINIVKDINGKDRILSCSID